MKTFRLLVLVAVIALTAQALGAMPVHAQAKIIKIASASPLSGSQSANGTGMRNATELAISQLAKPIEDMGFQVQFVPYDDQATPEVGVKNAHDIVNDAAILAVVGHFNSGVAIPSSEIYNQSDLVMVSPANTNAKVTDRGLPTVNRVCGRDDIQGPFGADYVAKELKAKSVYIVHDNTVYGQGVAESFRDQSKADGVQVLGFQGTNEKANFDAVLTPIAAQNPDVIYWGGSDPAQAGAFWKQAKTKGIKSQFFGPDGMASPDTAKIGGEAVVGLIFTSAGGPPSMFPDAKQFLTDYAAKYKVDVTPYAPEAYAATQVVLNALQTVLKANGGQLPARKDVAAAVRATKDFKSIIGSITFDANGDRTLASYYVLKITSSDPAKWNDNPVITKSDFPSPLTAKAMATAGATMAATAAK